MHGTAGTDLQEQCTLTNQRFKHKTGRRTSGKMASRQKTIFTQAGRNITFKGKMIKISKCSTQICRITVAPYATDLAADGQITGKV